MNLRDKAHSDATPDARLALLERFTLDLMMEVEALRAAVMELSSRQAATLSDSALADEAAGVAGPHSVYGKAYLETARLTHWSAGPSSGQDKLLDLFYDEAGRDDRWREVSMLQRLGYSEQQIQQYLKSARAAETCT